MNRLTRLALSLVVATMALPVAMGQAGLGNFGALCWDPSPDFDPFSDDFGYNVAENPVHVHDFQATVLHLLGVDHERLTYRFQGRQYRLTDVHGTVVQGLLA